MYLLLAPLALLTFWQIFENDLFYLLRAGHEIIHSRSIITTELWSFTAQGKPWLNHQWLSEVLFSLAEKAGGIDLFPALRAVLTFCILFISAKTLQQRQRPLTESLAACLFIFTVLYPRLQLRSELLVFVLFSLQVLRGQTSAAFRHSVLNHSLIILLWSQLHGGTAWIGGLYAFCLLHDQYRPSSLRENLFTLIPLSVMFISPLGLDILKVLFEHSQLTNNPELTGITWQNLSPLREGLTYSAAFLAAAFFLRPSLRPLNWVSLFLVLLLALGLYRARILPYFALGLLPLWSAKKTFSRLFPLAVMALATSVVALTLNSPRHYGWGIDPHFNPVHVSDFLDATGLQGRMLNHYNFGAFLLWAQPNRPVALDGRETPFRSFEKEMSEASRSPATWKVFLNKYRISFVVDTRPDESMAPRYRSLFPADEWAAIYADELAVVLARRNLTSQSLIERLEISF